MKVAGKALDEREKKSGSVWGDGSRHWWWREACQYCSSSSSISICSRASAALAPAYSYRYQYIIRTSHYCHLVSVFMRARNVYDAFQAKNYLIKQHGNIGSRETWDLMRQKTITSPENVLVSSLKERDVPIPRYEWITA